MSLCHKQLLIGLREGKIPFPSSLRLICDWPFHVAQLSARKLFPPFSDNADDTFLHFVAPSRSNSETRSATGRPKSTGICSFPHRLLFSLLVPTNLIDSHRSFDPEERTSSVEKSWAVVIKLLPSAIVILSASWMRACVSLLGTSNKSARDSLPSSKTKTKKKDLFFPKKKKQKRNKMTQMMECFRGIFGSSPSHLSALVCWALFHLHCYRDCI